ncbi:MAG: hypothetical protein JWO84_529 [Parcubacteria group bacterium]|nr:hypothetical protein [Parcubacteria group bacterium]
MRTMLVSILLSSGVVLASVAPAMAQETAPITLAAATDTSRPAGGETTTLVAAPSPTAQWTLNTSFTAKSGRDFEKQGFTLTKNPVTEKELTLCNTGGLCFDLWRADTKLAKEHETDFQVWKDFKVGASTLQVKGAYYELAGPDVWDTTWTLTHPLGKACAIAGSYEWDGGGFKENAIQAKGSCSWKVSEHATIDGALQISHSENFKQWVPGAEIGVSFALPYDINVRPFVKGFGGREPAAFFGVSVAKAFALNW